MNPGMVNRRLSQRGSATVELVFITPLVLAVTALVWDLREVVSYRTDLAREMYALAEVVANQVDLNPIQPAMEQAMKRFEPDSAGTLAVAVVTRGTQRSPGVACVDDEAWCLPMVTVTWPASPAAGAWNSTDHCGGPGSLPAASVHFEADQQVLPNENPTGSTPHEEWISRNMRPGEWWVVVDSCFDPNPGLLWGRMSGFSDWLFDSSGLVLRRRAAWGSVHDLVDCVWCGG